MEIFNRDHAFPSNGSIIGLPPQAISSRRKTQRWKEECLDALEVIGLKQYARNQRFRDYYLMKDGKLSFMELADVIPQMKDIQGLRSNVKIPSFLKHYDIIGGIVNAFEGWLTNLQDKYTVTELGDMAISEYEEAKSSLLKRTIQEQWDIILNQRLMEAGLDPQFNDFESDEERQAYMQQIEQAKVSMTPEEIEDFMNTRWKTQGAVWGDHTLESDRGRFYMDEMDRENFIDRLLTGEMYRNHFVGFDYYKPEVWSPMEVFRPTNVKYPQYGSYIGRIHYYEGTDLIARYGHKLTAKEKQQIMGGEDNYYGGGYVNEDDRYGWKSGGKSPLIPQYKNDRVPWKGFRDYQSITNAEDHFGIPFGEEHRFTSEGEEVVTPRFMPRFHPFGYFGQYPDVERGYSIDRHLFRVMEGYWVSMKAIYLITYQTESGMITQEIVTDELLRDFLEQNGIKKINRVMNDAVKEPEVNTYILEYVPEVRFGVKITGGSLLDKAIYIGGDPIPHQIHGDSSLYDFVIPVSGFVGSSLAERIQPFQMLYNLAMNQLYNYNEKEIGKFFLGDLGFIPSEYKDMVDKKGALATFMNIVKSVSFMGIGGNDTNNPYNPQVSGIHNQFGVYDLSNTENIRSRMEVAAWAYTMAYRMIGISEQAIGQSTKYETSTGVKQGMSATLLQTQTYFNDFDEFKKRTLDIHLAVAQVCQKEGQDWTAMYRNSDLSISYVSLTDNDLALRHLSVMAVSNSKKRLELENMKQYILQTNTLGSDLLDVVRMMGANSNAELAQIGRDSRRHMDRKQREEYERQSNLEQQKAQIEQAARDDKHNKDKELLTIKGEYDLRGKSIIAAGNAARKDSDSAGLSFVGDMADRALKDKQLNIMAEEARSRAEASSEDRRIREEIEREKLELKREELAVRRETNDTKRYTSTINKN